MVEVEEMFDEELVGLRGGSSTFDQFERRTRSVRRLVVARFLRKKARCWEAPAWVDLDDFDQAMLCAVWMHIHLFDPERGKTIGEYVLWNAFDRIKKGLHRARNGKRMHRGEESQRSRFERPVSSLARTGETSDRTVERVLGPASAARPACQDEVADLRLAAHRARRLAVTVSELLAVQAIEACSGDLAQAASMLYEDRDSRLRCGLGSPGHAERAVTDGARLVALELQS